MSTMSGDLKAYYFNDALPSLNFQLMRLLAIFVTFLLEEIKKKNDVPGTNSKSL